MAGNIFYKSAAAATKVATYIGNALSLDMANLVIFYFEKQIPNCFRYLGIK